MVRVYFEIGLHVGFFGLFVFWYFEGDISYFCMCESIASGSLILPINNIIALNANFFFENMKQTLKYDIRKVMECLNILSNSKKGSLVTVFKIKE